MTDNDYNIITSIERLQNIESSLGVKYNYEKKKQAEQVKRKKKIKIVDSEVDVPAEGGSSKIRDIDEEQHLIDYSA